MSKFSFEDIGAVAATFAAGDGVKGGQVVKVSDNGTAAACADGEAFCGVAMEPRKGGAAVQVKGFVTVPYTGALAVGWAELVADGQGGVRPAAAAATDSQGAVTGTAEQGVTALVVSVDGDGTAVLCL